MRRTVTRNVKRARAFQDAVKGSTAAPAKTPTRKQKKPHPAKGKPRTVKPPCARPTPGAPQLVASLSTWNWGGGGIGNFLSDPKGTPQTPLKVRTLEPNDLARLQTARLIREERVAIKRLALEEADYDRVLDARTGKAAGDITDPDSYRQPPPQATPPESPVPSIRWSDEAPDAEGLYLRKGPENDAIRAYHLYTKIAGTLYAHRLGFLPVAVDDFRGSRWLGPLPWPDVKAEVPS